MTDIEEGLIKGIIINLISLHPINQQLPMVILFQSGNQFGNRTLTGATFSYDCSKLPRL